MSLSLFVSGSFAFLLFQTVSAQFTPPCDTPPNCQPSTGSVTATLLDVLTNGGRAAEFGKLNPDADPTQTGFVGIGGGKRSDLTPAGEVRFGVGTTTPGFPLDVIAQTSGNPDNDTANLRLSYNTASPVWTGVKIDRKAGDEKWFVGMASSSDNLIIRSGANANIVEIPPGKGAACFGGIFRTFSQNKTDGNAGGYSGANGRCPADHHVCSLEEMYRTTICKPSNISTAVDPDGWAWINGGPITSSAIPDCNGWTDNTEFTSGTFWLFDGSTLGNASPTSCNVEMKLACCR
ncbi:MAG: hypothetical protein AAB416_00565 [Patescibacteria group bacterium]